MIRKSRSVRKKTKCHGPRKRATQFRVRPRANDCLFALLLLGLLTSWQFAQSAQAQPSAWCFVLIKLNWPQFDPADAVGSARRHASWQRLSRTIGGLLAEAFEAGGYEKMPLAFPVSSTSFEGDHAIFNMRTNCNQAQDFVRQMIGEYMQRLRADERRDAPVITVEEEPATKYQATCGLRANSSNCPEADREFPE